MEPDGGELVIGYERQQQVSSGQRVAHREVPDGASPPMAIDKDAAVADITQIPVVQFGGAREEVEGKRDSTCDNSGGMGRLDRLETRGAN